MSHTGNVGFLMKSARSVAFAPRISSDLAGHLVWQMAAWRASGVLFTSLRSTKDPIIALASAAFVAWCGGESHRGSSSVSTLMEPLPPPLPSPLPSPLPPPLPPPLVQIARLVPISWATARSTASAAASCGTVNAGTPGLMIPAFSRAICATLSPSTFMWSKPAREGKI